jgi:TRAP-type uncharacterized transport system substrate-binding protein
MKKILNAFVLATLIAVSFSVFSTSMSAQQATQIIVAADSSSHTYEKMLGELISVCNNEQLQIVQNKDVHGGAVGNLDALYNNKAEAAFLHSDVFTATAESDSGYNSLQTLLALWAEPIHVLALRQSKTPKLSTFSFGKQEFTQLSDLKGFKVGAAGGGVKTLQNLNSFGDAGLIIAEFSKGDDVIPALDRGDIAAAVFVGAAPLPNIDALKNKTDYKLLPVYDPPFLRSTRSLQWRRC